MNILAVRSFVNEHAVWGIDALERRGMLRIAVHKGSIWIEQKRSSAGHIVAPICQGVNSASP